MPHRIEKLCKEKGLKLTKGREVVAKVLSAADDHPDVEEVWRRATVIDAEIGIATVYRSLKLFEESGIITKHEFGKNKAHYEFEDEDDHHDHLIDVESGEIHEFFNEELEKIKEKVANDMGYELVDHKLELYCKPIKK
jgi:Fur family transcriptional regulator, ferric uptake regulator